MKYDAFQKHQKLFVFGICCLVICLSLLFFSLYIIPFLVWEINYGVPLFITTFITNMNENYGYTTMGAKFLIELLLLIPAFIAGLISYFISSYLDRQDEDINPPVEGGELDGEERLARRSEFKREIKESADFGVKVFALMVGVVVLLLILQRLL